MKTKMKSIVLALACAIAASTASADLNLKWFGVPDGNWWTPGNWWDTSANAIVSSDFTGDYKFDSIEFGDRINSNTELDWQAPIVSHTTINLGGNDRPITTSGDVTVSYYGRIINPVTWERSYDGGPIIFTNGTISVGGNVNIANNSKDAHDDTALDEAPPAVLKLQDVTLTCTAISILYGWLNEGSHGNGRLTVEDGALVSAEDMKMGVVDSNLEDASTAEFIMNGGEATFSAFTCSAKSYVAGKIALNGGSLNIPGFSCQYTSTSPDTTLRFNGGTLKASQDSNGNVNGSTFVPSWMKVEIGEGGIVIDSNGTNITFAATTVTQASGVTTDGGLTKKGEGMLTVTAGVVWNGPTKVLGGTLDLNGGTITGPLVLGGNGRIVNATIDTTDITIQSDYVFDTTMWDIIGTASVTISGAVSVTSPLDSILNSATAWYDPSDVTTLTTTETTDNDATITTVSKIANKSSSGSSMDTQELTENLPSLTTINNHNAIAFSGHAGFVSASSVSFDDPTGKSVFAVAQLNDQDGYAFSIEFSRSGWDWGGYFGAYLKNNGMDGLYRTTREYVDPEAIDSLSVNTEESIIGTPCVMSLRGKNGVEPNVVARLTNGSDIDVDGSASAVLRYSGLWNEYDTSTKIAFGFQYPRNDEWGKSKDAAVGEALAFARCLSDNEAETVQSYLVNKWVSSSIPATWPLTVGTLTLDGDVDFNGGNVTVTNALAGAGSIAATSLKVTGTITATTDATAETAQIAVTGDVDLTGASFAVDASLAESLAYNQSVTLLTSTGTITGLDSPVVLTVDTRKFKVRKSNGAITVTRMQPGLMIVIK